MPSVEPFGEKIRSLRSSLGLTQLELALRAGVSERTVRNAERSRPLRRRFLDYIGTAMGVAIQDVVRDPAQIRKLLDGRRHADVVNQMLCSMQRNGDIADIRDLMHPKLEIGIRMDPRLRMAESFREGFFGRSDVDRLVDTLREFKSHVIQWNVDFHAPRGDGNLLVFQGTEDCIYRDGARDIGWWVYVFEFEDQLIRRIDEYAGFFPWSQPECCNQSCTMACNSRP